MGVEDGGGIWIRRYDGYLKGLEKRVGFLESGGGRVCDHGID